MTVTFSHPPHPSQIISKRPQSSKASSKRDPHAFPTFDSKSLTQPDAPVLYLPPLLSSLPKNFLSHEIPSEYPPLVTETRLPDIDPASLSLHKALHNFKPITADYADRPYEDAFNWSSLSLPADEEREWYCVVFRSKRKPGSDGGSLYEADKLAHEEAIRNGGLILYWYGIPNAETGMNLATCIWQSRKHAIAANCRPHHLKAMKLAAESYEIYTLERYTLRKLHGETTVFVEPFNGGKDVQVGW